MKKVTLLGDSIRMIGYGKTVAEALNKDGVEVFQPEENCRFSKYTLRMLFDYKDQIAGSDVIHWNNGLWDVSDLFGDGQFSSTEEYCENMLRIADISRHPGPVFLTFRLDPSVDPAAVHQVREVHTRKLLDLVLREEVIRDIFFLLDPVKEYPRCFLLIHGKGDHIVRQEFAGKLS